jgi:hypothetical protein
LRRYLLARQRIDVPYFREHEEMTKTATNFVVFLFVTTVSSTRRST